MKPETKRPQTLREIEMEVDAEGHEWTRQRLQAEAGQHGEAPRSGRRLVHRRTRPMQLQTVVGVVRLEVLHGQDPADKHWGCPVREHWELTSHQQLSLALEDKLAFTVTATSTYAEAAAVAQKWGTAVDDSTLHALTRRLGERAEAPTVERLKTGRPRGVWPPTQLGSPARRIGPPKRDAQMGQQPVERAPAYRQDRLAQVRIEPARWSTS